MLRRMFWLLKSLSVVLPFDWCCFYYFVRNSLVALMEALCARIRLKFIIVDGDLECVGNGIIISLPTEIVNENMERFNLHLQPPRLWPDRTVEPKSNRISPHIQISHTSMHLNIRAQNSKDRIFSLVFTNLQNRDTKANENRLSVLNTQQTLRKYTNSVTKNIGCLSIAMSLHAP